MQGNILQRYPALLPWQVILPSGDISVASSGFLKNLSKWEFGIIKQNATLVRG